MRADSSEVSNCRSNVALKGLIAVGRAMFVGFAIWLSGVSGTASAQAVTLERTTPRQSVGSVFDRPKDLKSGEIADIDRPAFLAVAEYGSIGTRCGNRLQGFCRDLSESEFRVTSLRFLVPDVPGLQADSMSIRRNRISVNYKFR